MKILMFKDFIHFSMFFTKIIDFVEVLQGFGGLAGWPAAWAVQPRSGAEQKKNQGKY